MAKQRRPVGRGWRLLALLLLALLVRLAPLGRYVTPDEPIWVLRSIHFADAVAAGEWAAVPQTGHPGLLTMAVGALGVRLTALWSPESAAAHLAWLRNLAWLAPENGAAFPRLVFFLPAARVLMALLTAAGVAASYALGRGRIGERPARWLALFLALDPFFAGHAGLLHTDALQATFVLLGVLLALPLRSPAPGRRLLSLTGAALCLALAGLSKSLGLAVAPGVALAVLLLTHGPWRQRVLHVGWLAAATTAFYLLLYPPFWVAPGAALASLLGAAAYHEGIGLREVFFWGQMTTAPGPWFYPAVLLFRLTPPVLVGVLWLWRRRDLWTRALWFALPAAVYCAAITLGDKKFDRYALTLVPLLTACAVLAWGRARPRLRYVLLAALLWPWAWVAPAPLLYANPLLGGPELAHRLIPLGWNEGFGMAAASLSRQLPAAESHLLYTPSVPTTAGHFAGLTLPATEVPAACAGLWIQEGDTAPLQADGIPVLATRLAGLTLATAYTRAQSLDTLWPVLLPGPLPVTSPELWVAPEVDSATLAAWLAERLPPGQRFTWVCTPACHPLADAQLHALLAPVAVCLELSPSSEELRFAECEIIAPIEEMPALARFAGELTLDTVVFPQWAQAPDALTVQLRWLPLAPQGALQAQLALEDTGGSVWAEGGGPLLDARTWPASAWAVGEPASGPLYLPLPLTVPPGRYTVTLQLADAEGRRLGLWLPGGDFGGTSLPLGEVILLSARYPAEMLALSLPLAVEVEGARLLGAEPPPTTHWAGDSLPFSLGWERLPGEPPEMLGWTLSCEEGEAGGWLPVAPGPLRHWTLGERYIAQYAPRTDPLLPAGRCRLYVWPDNAPLWWAAPVYLGEMELLQRERSFALPETPAIPLAVTVADWARLVGAEVAPRTLAPGEALEVMLYWEALATPPADYTVFLHLVGPEGRVWAQQDAQPQQGAAPTRSWVAGQVIVDRYTLRLPEAAPPGDYQLWVGLYDAESGVRVSLGDSAGARLPEERLLAAQVMVAPSGD